MTEHQWLACREPAALLEALRGQASERKLRLFACACCRQMWHLLGDDHRRAVTVAEWDVDGQTNKEVFSVALQGVGGPERRVERWFPPDLAASSAAARFALAGPTATNSVETLATALSIFAFVSQPHEQVPQKQAALLRDIFGNPFRAVALAPSLLTPDIVRLAREAYQERDLPEGTLRLGLLASALRSAGFPADLVRHLEAAGPHVRGCWVVDALLGRS